MKQTVSYGPDKVLVGLWALLTSPPSLIWCWVLIRTPSQANVLPFLIALTLPVAAIAFASRFRVAFTPAEFVYRRWGPTIRVPYSEIDRIEVANFTPVGKQAVGAFLITKRGQRLPFWPKLFPREAVRQFFALGGQAALSAEAGKRGEQRHTDVSATEGRHPKSFWKVTAVENMTALLGLAIIAVSIAGLFWWGFHFQIFGTDIDWTGRPIQYGGFFAWMVFGAFGAGLALGGYKLGLRVAGGTIALFAAAAAVGVLRRGL